MYSRRADDEFGERILGNQKLKKLYYLNVSESGFAKGVCGYFTTAQRMKLAKNLSQKHTLGNLKLY
jgi:hypothetical protein